MSQQQQPRRFCYMKSRCRFLQDIQDDIVPRSDWDEECLRVHVDRERGEHVFLVPRNVIARASDAFHEHISKEIPSYCREIDWGDKDCVVVGFFINWLLERQMPPPPSDDLPRFDSEKMPVRLTPVEGMPPVNQTGTPAGAKAPTTMTTTTLVPAKLAPETPAPATTGPTIPGPATPVLPPCIRHIASPQTISQYIVLLVDLYLFAQQWDIERLQISTFDALAEAWARWWTYPVPEIRYIYSVTWGESILRVLAALRSLHSVRVFDAWWRRGERVLMRLVIDVQELQEKIGHKVRGREQWCGVDLCLFHDHQVLVVNGEH